MYRRGLLGSRIIINLPHFQLMRSSDFAAQPISQSENVADAKNGRLVLIQLILDATTNGFFFDTMKELRHYSMDKKYSRSRGQCTYYEGSVFIRFQEERMPERYFHTRVYLHLFYHPSGERTSPRPGRQKHFGSRRWSLEQESVFQFHVPRGKRPVGDHSRPRWTHGTRWSWPSNVFGAWWRLVDQERICQKNILPIIARFFSLRKPNEIEKKSLNVVQFTLLPSICSSGIIWEPTFWQFENFPCIFLQVLSVFWGILGN